MRVHLLGLVADAKFHLTLGALLLSAAVTLAVPAELPWPVDAGADPKPFQTCQQQFGGNGNPGDAAGCCTYSVNVCQPLNNDPNIVNGATGAFFRTDQWRAWGKCAGWFGGSGAETICTHYPRFTCALIRYYNMQPGVNCAIPRTSFWVTVGNDVCNPMAANANGGAE